MEKYSLPTFYIGGNPIVNQKKITYPARVWYQKTYEELTKYIDSTRECEALTKLLLKDFLGYTDSDHITDKQLSITLEKTKELQEAVSKIQQDHPIQYVLGYADFAGDRFYVNKDVLIPRPETEEMVAFMMKECKKKTPASILDIGTGSGCIAITLAKAFPSATVTGIDISSAALAVARQNAKNLQVDVQWEESDILKGMMIPEGKWSLIVSNPPYIPIQEKEKMTKRVVAHEPHEALFVPQEQPLLFYEAIAKFAHHYLLPDGGLFLEVHENYADDVYQLLSDQEIFLTTLHQDIHGKKRWVEARKKSRR